MRSSILALSLTSLLSLPLVACSSEATGSDPGAESSVVDRPSLATFTSDAAGFDTHSYWLDTGSEVVVFDAQDERPVAEFEMIRLQCLCDRCVCGGPFGIHGAAAAAEAELQASRPASLRH